MTHSRTGRLDHDRPALIARERANPCRGRFIRDAASVAHRAQPGIPQHGLLTIPAQHPTHPCLLAQSLTQAGGDRIEAQTRHAGQCWRVGPVVHEQVRLADRRIGRDHPHRGAGDDFKIVHQQRVSDPTGCDDRHPDRVRTGHRDPGGVVRCQRILATKLDPQQGLTHQAQLECVRRRVLPRIKRDRGALDQRFIFIHPDHAGDRA